MQTDFDYLEYLLNTDYYSNQPACSTMGSNTYQYPNTNNNNSYEWPSDQMMDRGDYTTVETKINKKEKCLETEKRVGKNASNKSIRKKVSRKRDTNKPPKPVSAYAHFFREKQADIKKLNPEASFGEVSKIVASEWDSLSMEAKAVYKKIADQQKSEYLKELATFKANAVAGNLGYTMQSLQSNDISNNNNVNNNINNHNDHNHNNHNNTNININNNNIEDGSKNNTTWTQNQWTSNEQNEVVGGTLLMPITNINEYYRNQSYTDNCGQMFPCLK